MEQEQEPLRRTEFLRVFERPDLHLGAERNLSYTVLGIAAALVVIGQNKVSIPLGILFYVLAMALLRWMAKIDPKMSEVWKRYMRFQPYYPARARVQRYIVGSGKPCKK